MNSPTPSRALLNIAENSQGADRRPRGGGPHHPEPPPLHQPRSLAGIPDRRVAPGRHSGKTYCCRHCNFFFKLTSNPFRLTSASSPRASRGRTTSPSAPASTEGGSSKTRCVSTRTAAGTATWAAVPAGDTWARTGGTGVTTGGRGTTMRGRPGGGKRRSGRRAGRRPCDGTGTISTSGGRATTTTVAAATKTTCTFGTAVTRNG